MHVEDCSCIIEEVIKNSNLSGIYNIKGNETYTVKDLVQQFENHFDIVFDKSFNKNLPWENIDNLDDSKIRSAVNIEPKWNLFDFIKDELRNQTYA